MAFKRNEYPEWVEKYRTKGVTIRKTKYGYGLYKCTSVYVKGSKYPKSVQEFLGMIYEDKGFVPKSNKEYKKPLYIEYGLSNFIMLNFKRTLNRASYDKNNDVIKLGIIEYIFGAVDERLIDYSYLTYNDENLKEYLSRVNGKRIHSVSLNIDKAFKEKIEDENDLKIIKSLLYLMVYDVNNDIKPEVSDELKELIERYNLKSW